MKKNELAQKITAWLTLGLLTLQPMAQAAEIEAAQAAPAGEKPTVTETANHTPLIQIAAPSAGGVSHNQYDSFSVTEKGAILNNSFAWSKTELAGYISGNGNLASRPASVIVNEVVGSRPSTLNGFLEVAGHRADVVIANPNGITVNGGGFLNTARAVLTTGRPRYDAAGLDALRVEQGAVAIEGKGLDARGAESVDILARAVAVNAGIWAKQASIKAGANEIGYADGSITRLAGDEALPTLDVAAVGGMYAGRIQLVGTGKGLGVNVEGKLSATEAVSLSSDGQLRVAGSVQSQGTAAIEAETLDNEGLITAGKDTAIRAGSLENHDGGRIYGERVSIQAEKVRNQKNAALEQERKAAQDILDEKAKALQDAYGADVTAFKTKGQIETYERNIEAAARAYDAQKAAVDAVDRRLDGKKAAAIAARKELAIEAEDIENSGGARLHSNGSAVLRANTVRNRGAAIESRGDMRIEAQDIENSNPGLSIRRKSTGLVENPERIRIDQEGHEERGQAFDKSEFWDLDNGYGAHHGNVPGSIQNLTFLRSRSQTSWDEVTASAPGLIAGGENLTLAGNVRNENSRILAGKTLAAAGGSFLNESAQARKRTITFGETQGSYTERRSRWHPGHVRKYHDAVMLTPQIEEAEPVAVGAGVYEGSLQSPDLTPDARREAARALDPFGMDSQSEAAQAAHRINLDASASLWRTVPKAGAKHLIETDPAFADRRRFLSSDRFYEEMCWESDRIPTRLGDGLYEQELLRRQVMALTGKRYLPGFRGDEEEYRALLDAGVAYAKETGLTPGIALSAAQAAALTSDMVWLETTSVTIDGKEIQAVYPRVYLHAKSPIELKEDGSLVGASEILIETKEALKNSGLLLGENLRAEARSIENRGKIEGKAVELKSQDNLIQGGQVKAEKEARLEAGGSFRMENKGERLKNQDLLAKTAGIAVQGENGVLLVSAGKDLRIAGGTLSALGKNGSILLKAGENIILDTDKLQSKKDMTADAANYLRTERSIELGTSIEAGGSISLAAGNELRMRAGSLVSESGDVTLHGKDIQLAAGHEKKHDAYGLQYKAQGLFSSTKTTLAYDSQKDTVLAPILIGRNITLNAENSIKAAAPRLAAEQDITLKAADISFTAEAIHEKEETRREVKKSGLMSAGLGIFLGTKKEKDSFRGDYTTQVGAELTAGGNVNIEAQNQADLQAADIAAGGNIGIRAADVQIRGAENIYLEKETHERSRTGLTLSLGGNSVRAAESVWQPLKRAGEVEDPRLKALYEIRAGRALYENRRELKNIAKGNLSLNLHIGLGTSKSIETQETRSTDTARSILRSGQDLQLQAEKKDIRIQGSEVSGRNVRLEAKGNIRLEAAEEQTTATTKSRQTSVEIGATYGASGLSGLNLNASRMQSESRETKTSYTPTLVQAQETVEAHAGKDIALLGSQVQGEKVGMNVGGSLTIETLQEKETYEEKTKSAGIGLSLDIHKGLLGNGKKGTLFGKPDISLSGSKGNIHSDYESAREQAGVFAGKEGFDIEVGKHTDLKGAVIASEAPEKKNRLSTGTLTASDIENKAAYSTGSIGLTLHTTSRLKREEDGSIRRHHGMALSPEMGIKIVGECLCRRRKVSCLLSYTVTPVL